MKLPRVKRTVAVMLQELAQCGPRTRKQLIDPVRPEGRSEAWGCSYFSRGWRNPLPWAAERASGLERASLYVRGMIVPVGKVGRAEVWSITPHGEAVLAYARERGVL